MLFDLNWYFKCICKRKEKNPRIIQKKMEKENFYWKHSEENGSSQYNVSEFLLFFPFP